MLLRVTAAFIHLLLWLGVAISPALVGAAIAVISCIILDDMNMVLIAALMGTGLVIGIVCAEKIRTTMGLVNFWGRLNGQPELNESNKG
ncbi:hypothetical protein L4D76_06935 [Photobacterium sagamiensis]|uniref:hypothetical protein n=1 Tax=Photobacterium sagamiensis TaxID=2910241 RepID=UPI003D0E74F6